MLGKPVAKTITNNYDQENINTKSEDWQLNCATLHIQQNWSGTNEKLGEQNKFMIYNFSLEFFTKYIETDSLYNRYSIM